MADTPPRPELLIVEDIGQREKRGGKHFHTVHCFGASEALLESDAGSIG